MVQRTQLDLDGLLERAGLKNNSAAARACHVTRAQMVQIRRGDMCSKGFREKLRRALKCDNRTLNEAIRLEAEKYLRRIEEAD